MEKLYFPEKIDMDIPASIRCNFCESGRLARRELMDAVKAENSFYEERERKKALYRKHMESRAMEFRKHRGHGMTKSEWFDVFMPPDEHHDKNLKNIIRDRMMEMEAG